MECVRLDDADEPPENSDQQFMLKQMGDRGMWNVSQLLNGLHFGATAARIRQYWCALRVALTATKPDVYETFAHILNGFKCPEMFSIGAYITKNDEEREVEALRLGIPTWATLGPRVSQASQEKCTWKTDHLYYFKGVGLTWPVDFDRQLGLEDGWRIRNMFQLFPSFVVFALMWSYGLRFV